MKLQFSLEKLERIRGSFSSAIISIETADTDVPNIYVKKSEAIGFLAAIAKEEGLEFGFLSDLTAVDENPPLDKIPDYGLGALSEPKPGAPRFLVVYHLLSMQYKDRLRIKVALAEGEEMPTATGLWKAADWLEREVYDMYGISFAGHPNMTRLLLDPRWVGHPQRKDYPIKRYQRFPDATPIEEFGLKE